MAVQNAENGVVWGLGGTQGHGNDTIQYSAYDFLLNLNRKYAAILYHFRHTASYLSKVADFNLPHLHLTPPLGVTPMEFCSAIHSVVMGEPRAVSYTHLTLPTTPYV